MFYCLFLAYITSRLDILIVYGHAKVQKKTIPTKNFLDFFV